MDSSSPTKMSSPQKAILDAKDLDSQLSPAAADINEANIVVSHESGAGQVFTDTFAEVDQLDSVITSACDTIEKVRAGGGGLMILTGAGMSVSSGVPVFRAADGTMSEDFLQFLANFNKARVANGLEEVDDWFGFSRPEMFKMETAKEAWHYWRWRILRAMVTPANDYRQLSRLVDYFGEKKVFVQTSNCDQLHVKAGVNSDYLYEIHGSLARLQCSQPCCEKFWPTNEEFIARLEAEPDWVPMCPECNVAALRPNVMIFGDGALVYSEIGNQEKRSEAFQEKMKRNWIVLEVGAGVVIPSIRYGAEKFGQRGHGLIRVNPSQEECNQMESFNANDLKEQKYWPLPLFSANALCRLCDKLELPPVE
jgi:NAD-dependent SIR2 family protein deacetylase